MKKHLSLFLALVLICTMLPFGAAAKESSVSATEATDVFPDYPIDSPVAPASARITFGQTGPLAYSNDSVRLQVIPGTTKVRINDLDWSPSVSIEVCFTNILTNTRYGVVYSSGSVSGQNITTEQMPAGEYKMKIRNCSEYFTIENGIFDYTIIG